MEDVFQRLDGIEQRMADDFATVMNALASQRDHTVTGFQRIHEGVVCIEEEIANTRDLLTEDFRLTMTALSAQKGHTLEGFREFRRALHGCGPSPQGD